MADAFSGVFLQISGYDIVFRRISVKAGIGKTFIKDKSSSQMSAFTKKIDLDRHWSLPILVKIFFFEKISQ